VAIAPVYWLLAPIVSANYLFAEGKAEKAGGGKDNDSGCYWKCMSGLWRQLVSAKKNKGP